MRPSTSISCIKNGQTRSAVAMFWRWQSGGAAAKQERKECLAGNGTEFEIKDYNVSLSETSQTLSPHNYFSKSWETHKNTLAGHAPTNTSSGDQLAEFPQPRHQCAPRQPPVSHTVPICRDWKHASHAATLTPPQESFVMTSFNILASELARKHRSLYRTVPSHLLAWSRRRRRILEKLDSCSPDIVCLQEVDRFKDVEEDLAWRGYAGLYKARTGEIADGCAIFWRKERFQLLQERSFEFSMLGMRNNVAQLCVLQLIVPGLTNSKHCSSVFRSEGQTQTHRLIVGNIHVLFNPRRGEIKLGQCRAFLEQVHNMSSMWHDAPVVIGGDFNSTPSSAVYQYLATSKLDLSNLDRKNLSGLVSEVPSPQVKKSRKQEPTHKGLKDISVELSAAELSSQKMGLQMTPSSEMMSMEGEGRINQTNPCASLDLKSEDRNGQIKVLEQILGSREQTADHGVSMGAGLNGATENLDASIQYTALGLEEACGNSKTHDLITDEASEGQCENGLSKYGWDSEELRIATGKPDCTLMHHDLNLHSAYSDIQGHTDTRDAKGEPLVTACHRDFLGTVDYIWRNDGLKTMRVLETVPAEALATNKGLPIMMWGSDHLALACELAFT